MAEPGPIPGFSVISGAQVADVLKNRERQVMQLVGNAYSAHSAGRTVNPRSSFLTFADRPGARIIALPASIGGPVGVDGIKWIASVPANIEHGIPRASAVLILNDQRTGYPFACLESSIISATRTAASAALAATLLRRAKATSVGFVGTGLIARYIHQYLAAAGFTFTEVNLFDLSTANAKSFGAFLCEADPSQSVVVHDNARSLIETSDIVVFATVAPAPHIHDVSWFAHRPLVLHISLRDLAPEIVLDATNVVDDVDHCLTAQTSLHLTETRVGNRSFVHGTIDDVAAGRLAPSTDRTTIVSPFGMGILDLAVAKFVYDELAAAGEIEPVPGFFHDLRRHG
ncbi:2,3-diaminopropionate biosynthesis protein SbnB [Micromonospora sp. AMSO12t]|uniref:2,3-diaminopropionate biosynthesis protein SbnB n=1 Tax=unclassified Micromonospora TaxID=2617518 RepID=UPI00124B800C|nr:2,3-diaminopropionate biosynthesis protein SbnB [Micromonospora sp. AMSO12t]KAB1162085.1 2,3-diaminopropionate biosynthesis protein SbnB [Micromonospora sp. AMSO12t]